MAKQKIVTRQDIISAYMEAANTFDGIPNIDQFCGICKIEEKTFFEFFDSILDLEKKIWMKLMEQAILTINSDPQFAQYSNQDKLLSLFYTFFENLTLNSEYLLNNLANYPSVLGRKRLFDDMKPVYLKTITDIFKVNPLGINQKILVAADTLKKKSIGESLWLQLTLLITFWKKDDSEEFVKTDAAIEKSVQVVIDIMDTSRLKNFIDFGKFLWNEKSNLARKR